MKTFQFLFPYIKKYKWHYFFGIIALLAVDVLQLYIPMLMGKATDGIKNAIFTSKDLSTVILMILGIVLVVAVGRFYWRYFIFGSARKIEYNMRTDFFAHLTTLSLKFYQKNRTGDLMALATNDLNAVRMMLGPGLVIGFDAIIMTLLILIQMFTQINVSLSLWATLPLPFIAIGGYYFGKAIESRFNTKQEAFAKLTDAVQENISGIRVIKAFVQENKELKAFAKNNKNNYNENIRLAKIFALMQPLLIFAVSVSITIVFIYGGYLTIIAKITLGQLVAFVEYLGLLIWPMMAFGMALNIFSQGIASTKRMKEVFDEEGDIVDSLSPKTIQAPRGKLTIRNLTFSYQFDDTPVLQNINLDIQPGQTLAILGPTGSGKTTLVNLLLRLYNPPKGTIYIDNIDLLDLTVQEARNQISYVPQDNFLFSDTIERNIGFSTEAPLGSAVLQYATLADVHQNIMDFPQQYQTIVGERGVTLSGGQKQRISIARALYKESPILILDDSLSAVDTKTEESIIENLQKVRENVTTILIAHRISTIQHADIIVVLQSGTIIESGTHETLLHNNGWYAEMVEKQRLEDEIQSQ